MTRWVLIASGANIGMRRTIPHLLGVSLGFGGMIAIPGLGVDRIIQDNQLLAEVLKWLSLAYMLWLASKVATSAMPVGASTDARPLGFFQAAALQWVNPKASAMALGALSAYAVGVCGTLVVAAVFKVLNLPSVAIWAATGQGLRGFLATPARLRLFNGTMAVLLIASMLPVLLH